jgi:hypothetical protein
LIFGQVPGAPGELCVTILLNLLQRRDGRRAVAFAEAGGQRSKGHGQSGQYLKSWQRLLVSPTNIDP